MGTVLRNRSPALRAGWAIFVAAAVVRLAVAVAMDGLRHPELFEYDAMARNLLAGRGLTFMHLGITYHSFAPPLHAWISAGSYWLAGSIVPAMLLQIAAGAALAVVAAAIAKRLFGQWIAASAAGLLVAVHPGLVVYNATKVHPLSFDSLFPALALLMFFLLYDKATAKLAVMLGVVVGLGTLSRSTIVVFLPIGAVWLLAMTPRGSRRSTCRTIIAAGVATCVVIAPWAIRDSIVHQRVLFLISTTGEDFWDGNNPYATGHSYVDGNHAVINELPPGERADLESQPDEIAQSQWFMNKATEFITAHPALAVRLTFLKFFHFWWFAPQTGVLYRHSWRQLYTAYYVVVLLLAAAGVWRVARVGAPSARLALLLGAFLFGLSALQSIYFVEARHRWAVEPLLLTLAGGGAATIAELRRRDRVAQ